MARVCLNMAMVSEVFGIMVAYVVIYLTWIVLYQLPSKSINIRYPIYLFKTTLI